jgi:UDP-N-acetylglucosamine:LPS N-acetylglucosamine transferase
MSRILILTAAYGEGHNAAARGVEAGLRAIGGSSVTLRTADLYADALGPFNNTIRRAYLFAINRTPPLWHGFYSWLDRNPGMQRQSGRNPLLLREMRQWLAGFEPDTIVTTFPVYNILLHELRPEPAPRLVTVVTDAISVHSIWHRAPCDLSCVINDDTADVLHRAGVPRERIRVTGFPVSTYFATQARPPLPDPAHAPRLLYIINASRFHAADAVRRLLQIPGLRITATYGRFDHHRAPLEELAAAHPDRLEVFGWTTRIPELLCSHHVVISKAGGATTAESMAAGCPMIVNQVVPGQEEGNWETLRRAGVGALCLSPAAVHECVHELFSNRAARWHEWKANLARVSRPGASLDLARLILGP